MSFQHLQLSEPVFGLFLANEQRGAFLPTQGGNEEGQTVILEALSGS